MDASMYGTKCVTSRLENIVEDEDGPASLLPVACVTPETPIESMEFLARSWSVSAMELSKALTKTHIANDVLDDAPLCSLVTMENVANSTASSSVDAVSRQSLGEPLPSTVSPQISPRDSEDSKELFLLHHALNPDFLSNQQPLRNAQYKSVLRGKTTGKWSKDLRERKKQEIRTHKAQLHAAVSVAAVATAVASLAAQSAASSDHSAAHNHIVPSRTSAALASAAALVASHCIEIAEEMGSDSEQILTVVNSAANARTNGDIMTLTAGAATALRGAATLKASAEKGHGIAAIPQDEEQVEHGKDCYNLSALNFVFNGGELLKRTRKGALHWKQVSFYINSSWQVIAKIKSKHMAGAFKKKKKCVVYGVYSDTQAWPGRDRKQSSKQRAHFGIKTADRIIEFECRSKSDKQMWTDGIQEMLCCRVNMK